MSKKLKQKELRLMRDKKNNDMLAKMVSVFFIIMAAFYPMFVGLTKYMQLTRDKTFFFWIVTGIGATCIICMMLVIFISKKSFEIENYYAEKEPVRLFSVAEWALLAFISWTFISAFVASWLNGLGDLVWLGEWERFEGFLSYLCYAVNFILIARFYKPQRLHLILVAGSAILISLYGLMQLRGLDIFTLFPFDLDRFVTEDGIQVYGKLSAYFRTTLGNVNIVSAYCSFAVVLFAALYALARSRWQYLYLGASIMSFALFLLTGESGEAGMVAILGAMILLIPYWVADRERLSKILIVLSGWCVAYACHSAYLSAMKRSHESGGYFAPHDQYFLERYTHKNITMFIILAAVLLAAGLCLLLVLKAWNVRVMKTAGIVFLPVLIIGGLISLEIIGSRLSDNPDNLIWQAREMMHGRLEDDFGSSRGYIWKGAVSAIPENPVFGIGPDSFYYAFSDDWHYEAMSRYGVYFNKAHNVFLQIAVCMGIPALLAFLIFLGGIFISAVRKAFERPLLLAFGAAALSYTIQSFFCVEVPITTPLLWIALGVMSAEIWMAKIGYEQIEL